MRLPQEKGTEIIDCLKRKLTGAELVELRRAVDFGLRHLGLPADTGLGVWVRPRSLFSGTRGDWNNNFNPDCLHGINLYLRSRLTIRDIFVLFHEMAHMRQFIEDALAFGKIGDISVKRWKGEHYRADWLRDVFETGGDQRTAAINAQYRALPWEMDANRRAYDLLAKFYAADYIEAMWPEFRRERAAALDPVGCYRRHQERVQALAGRIALWSGLILAAAAAVWLFVWPWIGGAAGLGAGGMLARAWWLCRRPRPPLRELHDLTVRPGPGEMFRESEYHILT